MESVFDCSSLVAGVIDVLLLEDGGNSYTCGLPYLRITGDES